ncbi:MAG: hypothetical protein IJB96_12335 [Lachnospira sp.]|nr:hypothetical protein [Lachnospira sp.]
MQERPNKIINYVLAYGVALLVANCLLELYLLPPVTAWVTANVSHSNIAPYASYILVFLCAYLLCSFIFKNGRIAGRLEKLTDFRAAIAGWFPAGLNGVLLIAGFAREQQLFDGPSTSQFIFHASDFLSIAFMCAVFVVVHYRLEKSGESDKGVKVSTNARVYGLGAVLALLLAVAIFTPNTYKNYHGLYHTNAYFNSIYNYMQGVPRTELNGSVYGFYGMFMAPLVKLFGGSLTGYFVVESLLTVVAYMCMVYAVANVVKNRYVKYITVATMAVYSLCFSYSVYRQLVPHRILFPSIIVAYMVWLKGKENISTLLRFLYVALGYVICMISVVWNLETGVVCLIGYTAYFIMKALHRYTFCSVWFYAECIKRTLYMVVAVIGAYGLVNIVNYALGGEPVTVSMFVFPVMTDSYVSGEISVGYPSGIVAWVMVAALMFAVIAYGVSVKNGAELLSAVAVITLGLMTYYINRSAYGNLQIVYFTSVLVMGVVSDRCLVYYSKVKGIVHTLYKSTACLMLTIMMVLVCGGIVNYPIISVHRLRSEYKKMDEVEAFKQAIERGCDKDTKALGLMVPLIYSDLGWDSGYYLLDVADIELNPDMIEFLGNDLNYELQKPLLIDTFTYEKLDGMAGLDGFEARYTKKESFKLYDVELMYYVPREGGM